MPKSAVTDWSTTAASNTDVGGINIDENCAPSGLNNAAREMMAQIATALAAWPVTLLKAGDGTVSAPSVTFTADTNTGFYRIGADVIGVSTGGVERLRVDGYSVTIGAGVGSTLVRAILGGARTTDGSSVFDLIGDTTYTTYGLRVGRNGGANGESYLTHRGTNSLGIFTEDAAPVVIKTTNTERARFAAADSTLTIKANTVTMWNGDGDIPFARISTNAKSNLPYRYTSGDIAISASSVSTNAHSLGTTPFMWGVFLKAGGTPELGYTAGDIVPIGNNFAGADAANGTIGTYADATNVYLIQSNNMTIVIPHKSTYTATVIDNSKWVLQVRAWV